MPGPRRRHGQERDLLGRPAHLTKVHVQAAQGSISADTAAVIDAEYVAKVANGPNARHG